MKNKTDISLVQSKELINETKDGIHRLAVNRLDRGKFFRVKDGVEIYGLGKTKLYELALEAGAVYKVNKVVLIKKEVFEEYLESFKLDNTL